MRISDWSSDVCSSDLLVGPTTLLALLNSLQMGFRTLAIEQRSSEVWQLLSAVKAEFGKFAGVLEKAHGQLDTVQNSIKAAGVRTRSEEHTSELQSLMRTSYAVFCLKKKKANTTEHDADTQNHNQSR